MFRNPLTRSRRRLARTPRLEGLEDRLCLASSVELFADGTLYIAGDNRSDFVQIADDGEGTVGVVGRLEFVGAGGYEDLSGNYDVLFDNVNRIVVETFGGNDSISYTLTDPLLTPRAVSLDLGSGNDAAAINVVGVHGVDLFVEVDLGRGNDLFEGNLVGDLLDAGVQFDVDGGTGNDDIEVVAYDLYLDGASGLDMILFGGGGHDVVIADLDFNPYSTGLVTVQVLGGLGNDYVGLNIFGVVNVVEGSSATIDGGPGRDRFGATPEVFVSNVEPVRPRR